MSTQPIGGVMPEKRKRPELLFGATWKVVSPLGKVYVTINEDSEGEPFEVFATLGKAGSAIMADVEAIGRLISLALRFGIPIQEVYKEIRGISSDRAMGLGERKVLSVPDAIAIALGLHQARKNQLAAEEPAMPTEAEVQAHIARELGEPQ